MEISILEAVWFALTGVLLGAFTATGGFDFGAGIALGFLKPGRQKDFAARSITPFWDANQVWLITAGGALFAAFPRAYSEVLSTMYTPVMLLLALLVLRVVGIEFYPFESGKKWRAFWGGVIFASSLLSAVLIGVALGAIYGGALLKPYGGFWEGFLRLFTPLSVCSGILYAAFFAAYGAAFLRLRAPETAEFSRVPRVAGISHAVLMLAFIAYAAALFFKFREDSQPMAMAAAGIAAAYICLSASARLARRRKNGAAFALDALFALVLVAVHCASAYPNIIPSSPDGRAMGIAEAASSPTTLAIMLAVAGIGVPLALAYNIYAWMVFRSGKGEY